MAETPSLKRSTLSISLSNAKSLEASPPATLLLHSWPRKNLALRPAQARKVLQTALAFIAENYDWDWLTNVGGPSS
jgi:hypothetical protein